MNCLDEIRMSRFNGVISRWRSIATIIMSYCAFIYTPWLKEPEINKFLHVLESIGIKITHLGKTDPPKKWVENTVSVLSMIFSGSDTLNYTHFRDSKQQLYFSIHLHLDQSWSCDYISFSSKADKLLIEIIEKTIASIECYAAIIGVSGGGKHQDWQIIYLNPDCPDTIRNKIIKSEQYK